MPENVREYYATTFQSTNVRDLSVNHIITPPATTHSGHQQPPQPSALNVPGNISETNIPITPATEPLPFIVDVQEDALTSAPTTPDFHDAIDAFL